MLASLLFALFTDADVENGKIKIRHLVLLTCADYYALSIVSYVSQQQFSLIICMAFLYFIDTNIDCTRYTAVLLFIS